MDDSTGPSPTAGVTTASASASTSSATTDTPTTDPSGDTETTTPGSTSTTDETGETDEGSSSSGGREFVLCDDRDPELRACYDFSGVGEGVLTDLSMYANEGEVGPVMVEPGPFGDAVRVGADAEISVPDSVSLDVEGPATWEAWIYIDAWPMADRVGILDNDAQYSIMLYAETGLRCNGGGLNVFAPEVPVGQLVHVACSHDQDEMTVWVDGEPIASATGGTAIDTNAEAPMSIGDTSPDFVAPFDGLVGGVRIWSEVRTQSEMTEAAAAAG